MASAALSPAHLERELESCELFKGLSSAELTSIALLITERVVDPATVLVREGDPANELIVILEGSVEVTKRVTASNHEHRLATLTAGTTLGEMTLVDRAPRAATARALVRSRIGVLSMDRLAALATIEPDIERRILRNLANALSGRLRSTNTTAAAALEQQLELERLRALMGRFVVFITATMVTYTFILKLGVDVLPANVTPSLITIPFTFVFAGALYVLMKRTGLPFDFFGMTFREWRPAVRDALLWTAATCTLAALFKLALIAWAPSFANERLFNLSGILDPQTTGLDVRIALLLATLYTAVAPLQEFIVRGGLQTALQKCLVGPSTTAWAILVSNALFASAHLHLSVSFAIVVFFPGLLWGAMFARRPSVFGVALSHVLCGWFAFLVLGFEPWY